MESNHIIIVRNRLPLVLIVIHRSLILIFLIANELVSLAVVVADRHVAGLLFVGASASSHMVIIHVGSVRAAAL